MFSLFWYFGEAVILGRRLRRLSELTPSLTSVMSDT